MKIAILSRNARCYSTRRLREAAGARGHDVEILDTLSFGIFIEKDVPSLTFRGKPVDNLDVVIPRIGASISFFGCAVVRQFEQMGVFTLNSSNAISVSRDKLRALQILSRHEIGMPPTAFVRRKEDVLPAIERVGGAPVIVKLIEGTQGIGVILADNEKTAEAIIETLQSTRQNVLIQKFVSESKGRDVRALVVGDRVVAAMRRRAVGAEFRSNVHRGGCTEAIQLDEAFERTAVQAAHALGLSVAGVDMLEGNGGPQIVEVNSSPGLEGIESATGVDVAGAMIDFIQEQMQFSDADIRQRLPLSRGYAVADITISPDSQVAGKTLAESGLPDLDIIVLSINRGGLLIANPRIAGKILPGDVLMCYGKRVALRSLAPRVRTAAPN